MSHALTPITPTTAAQGTSALASCTVPDGSDFRTAGSLYAAFQTLLNIASIAAAFVTGGTIGDGSGTTVTLGNALATSAGKDITSGRDVVANGDVTASEVHAGTNMSYGGLLTGNIATFAGAMTFFNSGRVVPRTHTQAGAAGMVANVATASRYFYQTAASGSTVQIDDTDAIDGDEMTFANFDNTNGVIVKDPSGATIQSIKRSTPSTYRITVVRVSGVWTLFDASTI